MGKTSNAAKQRWNKERYTQIKVHVPHQIAAEFKARCLTDNVSMASEIIRFMRGRCDERLKKSKLDFRIETRPLRRKSLALITQHVEAIMDAESDYRDSIPENLRGSCRYDAAEQTVTALEAALDFLDTAYE